MADTGWGYKVNFPLHISEWLPQCSHRGSQIFFEASKEVAPYWAFLERGSTGVGVKLSRGPLGPERRKGPEKRE